MTRELSVLYRCHPWLLDLNMWRPPPAPHVFDVEEAGYRTLIDTGLSGTQIVEALEIALNGLLDTLALVIARAQTEGPAVIPTLEHYAERMDDHTEWSKDDVGTPGDPSRAHPSAAEDDQPR